MNKSRSGSMWLSASIALPLGASVMADGDFDSWQYEQLFSPSPEQLRHERQGNITIYDGFLDSEVDRALSQQFARIENMMFVRIVITDESGQAETDDSTGEVIVEDDGCDD